MYFRRYAAGKKIVSPPHLKMYVFPNIYLHTKLNDAIVPLISRAVFLVQGMLYIGMKSSSIPTNHQIQKSQDKYI
jgi:hypothetical protein